MIPLVAFGEEIAMLHAEVNPESPRIRVRVHDWPPKPKNVSAMPKFMIPFGQDYKIHAAEFQKAIDVHGRIIFTLVAGPPKGWRWIVYKDRFYAEQVHSSP